MTLLDFFFQAAGFALQTMPIAILMCVPFDDDSLKFKRKKKQR